MRVDDVYCTELRIECVWMMLAVYFMPPGLLYSSKSLVEKLITLKEVCSDLFTIYFMRLGLLDPSKSSRRN